MSDLGLREPLVFIIPWAAHQGRPYEIWGPIALFKVCLLCVLEQPRADTGNSSPWPLSGGPNRQYIGPIGLKKVDHVASHISTSFCVKETLEFSAFFIFIVNFHHLHIMYKHI